MLIVTHFFAGFCGLLFGCALFTAWLGWVGPFVLSTFGFLAVGVSIGAIFGEYRDN